MRKTTILVMLVSTVTKLFGFLRELVLSKFIGANDMSDTINVMLTVPMTLVAIPASMLTTGLTPMLAKLEKDSDEKANSLSSNVLNIMLILSAGLAVVTLLFPEAVILLNASSFNQEHMVYASWLLRLVSVGILALSVVQMGISYLNVKGSFLFAAAIPIPLSVILMIAIAFSGAFINSPNFNYRQLYMGLGLAYLVGVAIQMILMVYYMRKLGFRYQWIVDFKDAHLRQMLIMALPLGLATILGIINDTFMRNMASVILGTGGYSYMIYANRLVSLINTLVVSAILTVAYPMIAKHVIAKSSELVSDSIRDAIVMLSVLVLPATVGFMLLDKEILTLIYGNGKLSIDQIDIMVPILFLQAASLLPQAFRDLFARVNYAYQDMRSPLYNTLGFSVLFIAGSLLLSGSYGLSGMLIAFSLARVLMTYPMYRSLKKHIGSIDFKPIFSDMSKIIASSALMGLAVYFLRDPLTARFSSRLSLLLLILAGVFVYALSVIVTRVRIADEILTRIRNRFHT